MRREGNCKHQDQHPPSCHSALCSKSPLCSGSSRHLVQVCPLKMASIDGFPRKQSRATAEPVAVEGEVATPNLEYERYLDLHRQLEGPARRRFVRKRQWLPSVIPDEVHIKRLPSMDPRLTDSKPSTVDLRLLPTLSVLYLLCSLDKSNAGNAKVWASKKRIAHC